MLRVCLLPVHSFLVVKGLRRCRKGAEHARISAVFKTLFASCHASNSFNPEYSPCNEQHHSLHTIIEAICTCDALLYLYVRCCDISSCADAGPPSSSLDVLLFL